MSAEASAAALERFLRERIPLTAALGVRVTLATRGGVHLWAPLAPNVNHSGTVFGGSAAAVATLAAWTLLHRRLTESGLAARPVIQRSRMEYERPIEGDFEARCAFGDEALWERFRRLLARRGRARITLTAELWCGLHAVGRLTGEFVAIADP